MSTDCIYYNALTYHETKTFFPDIINIYFKFPLFGFLKFLCFCNRHTHSKTVDPPHIYNQRKHKIYILYFAQLQNIKHLYN